jgi:hypothetical protein
MNLSALAILAMDLFQNWIYKLLYACHEALDEPKLF